jgi:uncharacterized protein (DUF433 family)
MTPPQPRFPSGTAHIVLDDRGRGWIDDTNVKVIEVVLDRFAWGLSPEEIHEGYPHLSLAQIHAALSYYYDHKAEYDAEIARQEELVERLRAENQNSPIRQKLRAMGKIP